MSLSHQGPAQRLLCDRARLSAAPLGVSTLILAGQVTEQCILYSALDGYIRHFDVIVPADTVAHIDPELGAAALTMMQRNVDATVVESPGCLPPLGHRSFMPRTAGTR